MNILDGRRTDFFQCVKVFFQPATFQNLNHYRKLADKANHNREQAGQRQPDILRKHDNKHCKQHNNGAYKIRQLMGQKGFNLFYIRIQNLFHFPDGIVRNITHWQLSDMLRHFQTNAADHTIGKSVGHHTTGISQHISHYQTSQTIQRPADHKLCVEYRSCGCMTQQLRHHLINGQKWNQLAQCSKYGEKDTGCKRRILFAGNFQQPGNSLFRLFILLHYSNLAFFLQTEFVLYP